MKKLLILRGGPSGEYEHSMKSGKSLMDVLQETYRVTDVIVDREGKWYVDGIEKKPYDLVKHTDLVINALHGEYGEDGKIQQLLSTMNVPFTGPKILSAALAMNRVQTKDLFSQFGLKTPVFKVIQKDKPVSEIAFDIYHHFVMPVIIKPVNKSSHLGLSIARDFKSLQDSLTSLFLQTDKLIVEEFIPGKYGSVGIVDKFRNQERYTSIPTGIFIDGDDIDHHSYFSKDERDTMSELASKAHEILNARHYSQSDFVIHPKRGVYILGIRNLPYISRKSVFADALRHTGVTYEEFIDHIISLALDRK